MWQNVEKNIGIERNSRVFETRYQTRCSQLFSLTHGRYRLMSYTFFLTGLVSLTHPCVISLSKNCFLNRAHSILTCVSLCAL